MNTIGKMLKEAREKKRYSLEKIEDITRIKKDFIKNIEEENWNLLPAFPVTLGFVKSISAALNLDQKSMSAFLKRDYPPKKIMISPKPDLSSKFSWNPKLTFFLGIGFVLILILGYTGYQYVRFLAPPNLHIDSPLEGAVVKEDAVIVSGKTDMDVKLTVNNEPVILDADGGFVVKLNVSNQTKDIEIKAVSRSGKTTKINRQINVE